jgi:hypothetical protein
VIVIMSWAAPAEERAVILGTVRSTLVLAGPPAWTDGDRGAGQHPGRPTAMRSGHRQRPVPPGRLAAASGGLLSGPRRPDQEMEAGP